MTFSIAKKEIYNNAIVYLPLNNVNVIAKRGSFGCFEIALMST